MALFTILFASLAALAASERTLEKVLLISDGVTD